MSRWISIRNLVLRARSTPRWNCITQGQTRTIFIPSRIHLQSTTFPYRHHIQVRGAKAAKGKKGKDSKDTDEAGSSGNDGISKIEQEIKASEAALKRKEDHVKELMDKATTKTAANPAILEGVMVKNAYGKAGGGSSGDGDNETSLLQLATVTVRDGKTLAVTVYDKDTKAAVDNAIRNSNLGLNPVPDQSMENRLLVMIPAVTKESKEAMRKQLGVQVEQVLISMRNEIKRIKKILDKAPKSVGKDHIKDFEKEITELVSSSTKKCGEMLKAKTKELEK